MKEPCPECPSQAWIAHVAEYDLRRVGWRHYTRVRCLECGYQEIRNERFVPDVDLRRG